MKFVFFCDDMLITEGPWTWVIPTPPISKDRKDYKGGKKSDSRKSTLTSDKVKSRPNDIPDILQMMEQG